ncbi:MAG: hypothetical protein PW789_18700 [Edaphobacter sp.]|uniref:hypothetical protein n=1 Tax=Edaphobacter sp. TaxID=1934404 RepID=UPI0023997D94|nr:hypothetical protein [Edaphobacter sp.]MDE1178609.1 hypothetical protein [Edaphobacter sp.]
MPIIPSGKYQLRTLHEEISLLDRKLAHEQNFGTFASEDDKTTAIDKLNSKRSLLIRKAQQMIDEGIEFNAVERPKSLRPEETVEEEGTPIHAEAVPEPPVIAAAQEEIPSPYAGTALDYKFGIEAYSKRSKSKAS